VIASLRGKVLVRNGSRIIVDVHGVGYDVWVSLPTLDALNGDDEVLLHIYTALRENSLELFGFAKAEEKRVFEILLGVSGIGPRLALNIVSGISPGRFRDAVLQGDAGRLTAIPGIGRKVAERLLVELKEKIKKLPFEDSSPTTSLPGRIEDDLVSSLVNLGYKERQARPVARAALAGAGPEISLTDAVRLALRELAKS